MKTNVIKERQHYLDNIRVICVLSLFIFHTCEIYHMKEGFYIEGEKNLVATLIYNFPSPWLMCVLFFIAGISTMYSLKRRTIKQFYFERVRRLLVPFLVGLIFIVPIQSYWTMKNHYDFDGNVIDLYKHFFTTISDGFYGYDGGLTPSHLWFLLYLMGITLICYPIIKHMLSNQAKCQFRFNIGWMVLILLIVYVVSYTGNDESIGKFILFYVLGIAFYDNEEFFLYLKNKWKVLMIVALVSDVITAYDLVLMKDAFIWSFDYAWMRLVWAISCISSVWAVLGAGQVFLNSNNKIWSYLSSRSFSIYYIHMTVLVTVAYFVIEYALYEFWIQALIIIISSIIVTFVLVEVLGRVPLISKLCGIEIRR